MTTDLTTAELKAAWQRAGLWRTGISYQRAIASPLLLSGLRAAARAARKQATQNGNPAPQQRALI